MPGINLTREEAAARAGLLAVESYEVELDLTTSETTFRSTTTITFTANQAGESSFVELIAPAVYAITLNGTAIDPATAFDGVRIQIENLAEHNELRIVADCAYMNTGEGLHRFVDPVDKLIYLYSQFQVADSRRMYACFEQPDLKGRFQLTVIAPQQWQVVSNSPTPTPQPLTEGKAIWVFEPTPPISTYITGLVAGDYHVVRSQHSVGGQVVPLGVFCRQSMAEFLDPDEIFDITRRGFDYFLDKFDYPYPFAKYDQLFVPEFNAGAMENAGLVTIFEDYVFRSKVTDAAYERRAETILHELAHMWFGNLVTMRWWDDLWLNESFATYISVLCQAQATRWRRAWTTFANSEKAWAYRQDQLPSTHPIVADIRDLQDVQVNFDGITYAKGASVLKQLVAWVGLDNFIAGTRQYFNKYEWSNTTLADLLAILSETSGRDLSAWSKEWLETAGVNTLRADFTVDEDGRFSSFAIVQEAPEAWPTLRSHRIAIGLYDRTPKGAITRRDRLELDISGPRTEVADLVGILEPDLVLLNDDDLTYTKIRLDPKSLTLVTESISAISESLPRALCWSAAWDMCRDAEMPTRDYLKLVLGGIGTEPDISVAQTLLGQTKAALDRYADPAFRPEGLAMLAARMRELLFAAAPGSDHQLAWARAFVNSATSAEDIALIRGLLAETERIEGLPMDPDLRWHFLTRLVVLGAAGETEIDAELDRDSTAAGQRYAAMALAARPTPQAKAEAWHSVVEKGDLPNAIQAAVIGGFSQPEQLELLEPCVPKYFDSLTSVWETRTYELAQQIVTGMYPYLRIQPDTLERTDRFLASTEPVPAQALRRLVLEGRDGVARALRAQECDAAAAGTAAVAGATADA
ncbi:MAG: aminopeptidase N [Sporichthyaceae bacterium]|nr:aminopeptidase N [Sporichthyaceae bacterium]